MSELLFFELLIRRVGAVVMEGEKSAGTLASDDGRG